MLQNMAFQCEQKLKSEILTTLGADQLFRLLADQDVNVLMKTLGLLRNLLSTSLVSDARIVYNCRDANQYSCSCTNTDMTV